MCPFPVLESCGTGGNGEHWVPGGEAAASPCAGAHSSPRVGVAPPGPTHGWVTVGEPGQHFPWAYVKTN